MLGALAIEAAHELPGLASGHGLHPMGIPPLRAAVAKHLSNAGLPTRPDQVLITQGALHGWDLVLRALASPGDRVVIEQPSYPGVLDAARAHSARVIPLGVTAEGWQLDRSLRTAGLVHVTPDHQNPTGFTASVEQRRALLAATDAVVVVDETFADLSFTTRQTPMAALDRTRRTITVGSLSKSVWAGIRVGWLRASPELVRRISMSRSSQDLATPVLEQLLAVRCLDQLPAIRADRVALMAQRHDHLLAAIADRAPSWTATPTKGGLVLWVHLGSLSSAKLAVRALEQGVRIIPGGRFSPSNTHDRFLRLPFCYPTVTLDRALDRLLLASEQVIGSARGASAAVWTA